MFRGLGRHGDTAALRDGASSGCVVLACGPNISDATLLSHMSAVLDTERRLAVVLLRTPSVGVEWFIDEVRRVRGADAVWVVDGHAAWERVPEHYWLAVLSSGGFYLGDDRVLTPDAADRVTSDDLCALYRGWTRDE